MNRIKIFAGFLFALFLISPNAFAQTAPLKFGSLAIDRNNGFYYGFSYDQNSLSDANNRALAECTQRGGNCTVVLEWSGGGCAAYRTISKNAGSAFGWGLGSTKEEADAIALRECQKRSNGVAADHFVWGCNSGSQPLKDVSGSETSGSSSSQPAAASLPQGYIDFNGNRTAASGECLSENVSLITADDESIMIMFNNVPSSGTATVTSDFYTNGCSSCISIQVQDLRTSTIYVATGGSYTRNGNSVSYSLSVQELTALIEGSGSSYQVAGKFSCEE